MSNHLKAVKDSISRGVLDQQLVGTLKRWPVIHFTEHAEAILKDGFTYGEEDPGNLDLTYDLGGKPKQHPGPGYNFAFNALHWDVENDMHEFLAAAPDSGRGLMGMYAPSAILFLADGLHTRHYDEFHQVIFWGSDADLGQALHLKQLGEQIQDGEVVCDVNGNPVDCWTILDGAGKPIIGPEDYLTLQDCVVTALHHYHGEGILSAKASRGLADVYEPELAELELVVTQSALKARPATEAGIEP
ncbi:MULTISPECIES: hypothetical protein [Pseudomonas]|uniref:hypothetical protein n=1 Tax=Pseudomonas TaxID=286 RepID=UPI0013CF0BD6|nr:MULTISPECIES: hypothetical protein [Pseudomonas]MBD8681717.1 hypothetical protein [Pseudomonas sp. CFBP 13719]